MFAWHLFFYRIERNGQDGDDKNYINGAMKKAIKDSLKNDSREVNVEYFYRMLCTMGPKGNMNLVHEKCHPESHPGQHLDPNQLLKNATGRKRIKRRRNKKVYKAQH